MLLLLKYFLLLLPCLILKVNHSLVFRLSINYLLHWLISLLSLTGLLLLLLLLLVWKIVLALNEHVEFLPQLAIFVSLAVLPAVGLLPAQVLRQPILLFLSKLQSFFLLQLSVVRSTRLLSWVVQAFQEEWLGVSPLRSDLWNHSIKDYLVLVNQSLLPFLQLALPLLIQSDSNVHLLGPFLAFTPL